MGDCRRGRCRPMSGAEWQPLRDPGWVKGAPGQAQPANMGFYKVVISIEINNTNECRTLVSLRNIIHYCPLPLIINSSISDLRVTDSHFLIISS